MNSTKGVWGATGSLGVEERRGVGVVIRISPRAGGRRPSSRTRTGGSLGGGGRMSVRGVMDKEGGWIVEKSWEILSRRVSSRVSITEAGVELGRVVRNS